jgi:hypothetical protein
MYTVFDGAQILLAMMGMRCALFLFRYAVLEGRRDPAMIPGSQKQLNIAFPKLTASYCHEARYRTLRMGKPALFRGCKTSTKINSCTAAGANSASDWSAGTGARTN